MRLVKEVWRSRAALAAVVPVRAPYDGNGRIAIVDPTNNELQLVDAGPVAGDRRAAAPVERRLRPGKYSQIASTGHGLALIDSTNDKLVTLDAGGKQWSVQAVGPAEPSKTRTAKPSTPPSTRPSRSNEVQIHEAYTLSTDGNGDLDQEKFHNSRVGETVYVTATGPGGPYTSNSFKRPAG